MAYTKEYRSSKICCFNVICFWADIDLAPRETYRVLRSGRVFVVSYAHGSPDRVTKFPAADVETAMINAGFTSLMTMRASDTKNGLYFCTLGSPLNE